MSLVPSPLRLREYFTRKDGIFENIDDSLAQKFEKILENLRHLRLTSASKLYENYFSAFTLYIRSLLLFHGLWPNSQLPLNLRASLLELVKMNSHQSKDQFDRSSKKRDLTSADAFDEMLSYQTDRQAEITTDMIAMTRRLKANSLEANSIIKRDVKVLEKAKLSAEENSASLRNVSEKIGVCTKDGMNWYLIALIFVVFIIFINMVLFMKFTKKS